MSTLALTLILFSAILHPTWNLLAKRATHSDPIAFVWLTSALSAVLYVPIVIALSAITPTHLHDARLGLAMMAGTGTLHVLYFVLLQRGYRVGEFSLVYPLARGTGPLVTAFAAVPLFGERLAALQVAGAGIIVIAIFVIAGGHVSQLSLHSSKSTLRRSLGYGIMTGVAIASYTLWDKAAVSTLAISPILYDFGRTAAQTLLLAPSVLSSNEKRSAARLTWRQFRGEAFGVAILSPLAYVLILYALTMAPVSLVAPLRESSIIFGAFIGAHFCVKVSCVGALSQHRSCSPELRHWSAVSGADRGSICRCKPKGRVSAAAEAPPRVHFAKATVPHIRFFSARLDRLCTGRAGRAPIVE